jgi:hypothetical protein
LLLDPYKYLYHLQQCICGWEFYNFKGIAYDSLIDDNDSATAYITIGVFLLIELIFWLAPLTYSITTKFLKILSLKFTEETNLITLDAKTSSDNNMDGLVNQELTKNDKQQPQDSIEITNQKQKRLFSVTDHKDKTIIEFK